MGLLDSVLGNVLGGQASGAQQGGGAGALINIIAAMLANSGQGGGGGLAGLAEQFQRGGLGDVMGSWVGSGQNQPISPDQLGDVLGGDLLGQLTRQTGMDSGDLLGQLSQVLPQMVDQATPEGRIPDNGLGDIGAILGRFGQPG
ncbi:MAG: YidB family protein [Pseudomonadota bacterium]